MLILRPYPFKGKIIMSALVSNIILLFLRHPRSKACSSRRFRHTGLCNIILTLPQAPVEKSRFIARIPHDQDLVATIQPDQQQQPRQRAKIQATAQSLVVITRGARHQHQLAVSFYAFYYIFTVYQSCCN